MKISFKITLLISFCLFFSCGKINKPKRVKETLISGAIWQLWHPKLKKWYAVSVPGSVQEHLWEHKLIDNPLLGENELKIQWISDSTWLYKTQFEIKQADLLHKNILHLDGINTYAFVYLNQELVGQTNNAFLSYSFDVGSILKTKNILEIKIMPNQPFENEAASKLAYTLPEGDRIFSRKPQFEYGWDWSPKMLNMGIEGKIVLTSIPIAHIHDVYYNQKSLTDNEASIEAEIEITSINTNTYTLKVFANNELKNISDVEIKNPNQKVSLPFQILNPEKWWPQPLGRPNLYELRTELWFENELIAKKTNKIGLRTLKLKTPKDNVGEGFFFEVNGVPVYAKGANYVPPSNFIAAASAKRKLNLLVAAKNANMNMLRVWGGGKYETNEFYAACDSLGIMIWQDFMFACAMYPANKAFLDNVKQEATQQIKRLRNFSCIALWCGNNESAEGWHRWGWQNNFNTAQKQIIWNQYNLLFHQLLPQLVDENTQTTYWASSPLFGRGDKRYLTQGDAHDWWVWHDAYPFEHFKQNVPRFMSEFGFQSYPDKRTIAFIQKDSINNLKSATLQSHQKHIKGFETIQKYMEKYYPVAKSLYNHAYISQLLQAYGIEIGIEAHRMAKPYNMGTLYWQLNDCWPAISWSSIDYFGHWKALHFAAKRAFNPFYIAHQFKNDTLHITAINDFNHPIEDTIKLSMKDFEGNEMQSWAFPVKIDANRLKLIAQMPFNTKSKNFYWVVSSKFDKRILCADLPKNRPLMNPELRIETKSHPKGFLIMVNAKKLTQGLFLYSESEGAFSDNYFDLDANETKTILFLTKEVNKPKIKFKSLNEIILESTKN